MAENERVALVVHTFLDDPGHYERCIRWLHHHARIKPAHWDLIAIDNGSSARALRALNIRLEHAPRSMPRVISFSRKLVREGLAGYEYTWRAVALFPHLAHFWQYDRIVFMESDFFICSQRMLDYASSATGLSTVFSRKYNFPESAFIVYTPGAGNPLDTFFPGNDWRAHLGSIIEERLPWTHVNREMTGDRYEDAGSAPSGGVDFAAQMRLEDPVPTFQGNYNEG